ncbi:aminodeoxychorismate synthase component I [Undibacterium cyanobacteriorum]|uniref:Aminodeoxychorismate synthase component I n=1 Tax=Undibacterium cyanobacteriorum TaxID=3073561 RepID=A0ABY9RJZ4_9BURK|nr:aminodeoxychorismate synthase component I [Undibacterium sp. 20NA77.5]WMW80994.1 aminodeoxychorismate synthase component I [Undibacterium sp. 20NA77.5]
MQSTATASKLRPLRLLPSAIVSLPTPNSPTNKVPCIVLLDDAHSREASSRLYTDLLQELVWNNNDEWDAVWAATQDACSKGYHAVSFLQYESGAQLLGVASRSKKTDASSRILIFRVCQKLSATEAQEFLRSLAGDQVAGIRNVQANVTETEFAESIQTIRDYIAAGDTYQVNYTYRLHFSSYGPPAALYLALRQRQPVPYGAFAILPDQEAILSFSPELFVRHQAGTLLARPMKGTAAASGDDARDQETAEALSKDPKNRAENLMIVDLLRNDLGRIAQIGTVSVPSLFEVTRFSSVLQMTSSIEAKLKPQLSLAEIMRAVFPCGSITGAPKKRTMEIIREIESEDRGLYTGAIGWLDPVPKCSNATAQVIPNFCFSVPIRTLELQVPNSGERRGRMGVGAGIVYDSVANEEYAECQLKARFLTGLQAPFELFETIFATPEDGCRSLEQHLQRMQLSAQYFGFPFHQVTIETALQTHLATIEKAKQYRLKISLNSAGEVLVQSAPLTPLKQINDGVGYLFEGEVCRLDPLLLGHKTTIRAQYDEAWKRAEANGGFDSIFVNQANLVTEGGRSTVFVKLDGAWFTPPLKDGVLPGILRAQMLADATWGIQERSISVADFLRAEEVMLGNSLRGLMKAYQLLETEAHTGQ